MSEIVHSWGAGEQAGQDKAIVWVDGEGVAHYRASALSACQNALLMARLEYQGTAAPEWMQERFDQGHVFEPMILNRVASYGNVIYAQQDTTEMQCGPGAVVSGHIDGLMRGDDVGDEDGKYTAFLTHYNGFPTTQRMEIPGGFAVIDAKAFATSTWERWKSQAWEAFPYYAWQQVIYGLSVEAAGVIMAVYHKTDDEVAGGEATCDGELRIEYWDLDKIGVTKVDIIKKVLQVERLAKEGPEAIFRDECSVRMFPCPFWSWHPEDDKRKLATEGMDVEVLATLAEARIDADRRVKQASADKDAIDDQIRAVTGGVEARLEAGGYPITVYRAGYSTTAWDEIGALAGLNAVEAKQKFTTSAKSDKLSVKIPEPKRK